MIAITKQTAEILKDLDDLSIIQGDISVNNILDVKFFTELVSSMLTWEPHDRPPAKTLINRITSFEESITQKS